MKVAVLSVALLFSILLCLPAQNEVRLQGHWVGSGLGSLPDPGALLGSQATGGAAFSLPPLPLSFPLPQFNSH